MRKSLVTLLCLCLVALGFFLWRKGTAFEYATHESPDGKFVVRVMEYPRLLGHLPGDAGGGGGYVEVELVDTRTNEVLKSQATDLVLTIETVRREPNAVDIKLFAEWPLPQLPERSR